MCFKKTLLHFKMINNYAVTMEPSRRFGYFAATEPSVADLLIHSRDGDREPNQTTTAVTSQTKLTLTLTLSNPNPKP